MLLIRAGGGQNFGGGGGGGGGGVHIGGGGGVFVGGGGSGGGGSIFLTVIVIGAVLFVLFGVTMFRRRRGGGIGTALAGNAPASYPHTDAPAYPPGSFPWDAQPQQAAAATGPETGLAAIQAHDPDFNVETFKSSVERVFFIVEEAWQECKPDMSRRVMADGLWQQHRTQIEGYEAKGQRNVLDGLAVGKVEVIRATSDDHLDTITTRILAACADYDVETASGKVVRGNKHDMSNWQEDWLFQRSSKATTKAEGTFEQKCPNCGAPLDLDLAGICKYCRAPVMSGDYDWVLARIDQV